MTALEVRGVTVRFGQGQQRLTAVDRVDLVVPEGTTVGLVGESGSGKSTLARALVGLVPIAAGEIVSRRRAVPRRRNGRVTDRRRRVQVIFQDPFSSLSPRMTVGAIFRGADRRGGIRRGGSARAGPRVPRPRPPRRRPRRPAAEPALRRPAPARGDRAGARRAARGADRRRDHVVARRVGAERRAQPDARPAAAARASR